MIMYLTSTISGLSFLQVCWCSAGLFFAHQDFIKTVHIPLALMDRSPGVHQGEDTDMWARGVNQERNRQVRAQLVTRVGLVRKLESHWQMESPVFSWDVCVGGWVKLQWQKNKFSVQHWFMRQFPRLVQTCPIFPCVPALLCYCLNNDIEYILVFIFLIFSGGIHKRNGSRFKAI